MKSTFNVVCEFFMSGKSQQLSVFTFTVNRHFLWASQAFTQLRDYGTLKRSTTYRLLWDFQSYQTVCNCWGWLMSSWPVNWWKKNIFWWEICDPNIDWFNLSRVESVNELQATILKTLKWILMLRSLCWLRSYCQDLSYLLFQTDFPLINFSQ